MLTVVKSSYTQQKYRIYIWSKVNAYTSLPEVAYASMCLYKCVTFLLI